jgi:hypothetical protein
VASVVLERADAAADLARGLLTVELHLDRVRAVVVLAASALALARRRRT